MVIFRKVGYFTLSCNWPFRILTHLGLVVQRSKPETLSEHFSEFI